MAEKSAVVAQVAPPRTPGTRATSAKPRKVVRRSKSSSLPIGALVEIDAIAHVYVRRV